ncbi:hypothetical protein EBO15_04880 [Actinomadura harenae]|uniref:Uncharacterized protein n=1 Tax=Actinomadura harenae TaxID=2483351 RepID=A0A3M2MBT0_9ACTN|nr:hypothetical protein EBO15_04880 [Actinomadura harenae]
MAWAFEVSEVSEVFGAVRRGSQKVSRAQSRPSRVSRPKSGPRTARAARARMTYMRSPFASEVLVSPGLGSDFPRGRGAGGRLAVPPTALTV